MISNNISIWRLVSVTPRSLIGLPNDKQLSRPQRIQIQKVRYFIYCRTASTIEGSKSPFKLKPLLTNCEQLYSYWLELPRNMFSIRLDGNSLTSVFLGVSTCGQICYASQCVAHNIYSEVLYTLTLCTPGLLYIVYARSCCLVWSNLLISCVALCRFLMGIGVGCKKTSIDTQISKEWNIGASVLGNAGIAYSFVISFLFRDLTRLTYLIVY